MELPVDYYLTIAAIDACGTGCHSSATDADAAHIVCAIGTTRLYQHTLDYCISGVVVIDSHTLFISDRHIRQ